MLSDAAPLSEIDRHRDDCFARVCNAIEYADNHLGEDLSLRRLAEAACFSPRHFHRIFTSILGETPDDCVRRLRLQKAASLVLHSDKPTMTEIAHDCGFSSPALFSRNFARHYGKSPTAWRDGMKRQEKVPYRQVPVAPGKDPRSSFKYLMGRDEDEIEVEIRRLPAVKAYCVPYLYGYDEGVASAYSRLVRWARPRGLLSEGSRIVSIPLDNPSTTPPKRCRNYVGIIPAPSIGTDVEGGQRLVRAVELGGTYLRARYLGPSRGLHTVYRLLYEAALPSLGFAPSGGKGFIEYPNAAASGRLGPGTFTEGEALVHVHVRPA